MSHEVSGTQEPDAWGARGEIPPSGIPSPWLGST